MNKDLVSVFEYLEKEKGIKRHVIISAIEESLEAAARKSVEGAANVTVTINPKTANIEVYSEKEIVDEVEVPAQEIHIDEAKKIDPDCEIGQFIDVLVTPKNFGRIAAQKARQIIQQKLRSAEKDVIYEEFRHRINELLTGTVKRFVRGSNIIIDLGKVEALMPMTHYPKTESYKVGDRVLTLLLEVHETENGGAEAILTRSHPEFVKRLIAQEVPEVEEGSIIIDHIVREPGYRTKLTVRSTSDKIDPVGACVGIRGIRIKNVVRELHNEKIDIIPFVEDPIELLQNALSPIEIRKISFNEEENILSIVVQDEDFPIVVGKRWWNAKLLGKLIGYQLDVQRLSEHLKEMAIQRIELAHSDLSSLNEPLKYIEGINTLIFEDLKEKFPTMRDLLLAKPEELMELPGISSSIQADSILESARNQIIKKEKS
jgi:transcription termination/antitermination protein NusA